MVHSVKSRVRQLPSKAQRVRLSTCSCPRAAVHEQLSACSCPRAAVHEQLSTCSCPRAAVRVQLYASSSCLRFAKCYHPVAISIHLHMYMANEIILFRSLRSGRRACLIGQLLISMFSNVKQNVDIYIDHVIKMMFIDVRTETAFLLRRVMHA